MNDPIEVAIGIVIVGSTFGGLALLGIVVRGVMQKWTQRSALPSNDVTELRDQVGQLGAEVVELQERLDFAERVLSQRDVLRPAGDG